MAEIEDNNGSEIQDAAHAKALKSMGSRVDPDTTPPADPAPADDPKDPPADPVTPPAPSEEPTDPPKDPPATDPKDPVDGDKRNDRHIPIAKYHDDKKEWEKTISAKDTEIARLTTELSKKDDNPAKDDEEVKAFAEQYGIDEAGLDQMTKILAKKILPEDKRALLDELVIESENRKETEFFHKEFEQFALPELKTAFGDIPADKLPAIEKFLDEVGHTKEFHDKELGYVIFKKADELKKLIGEIPKVEDKKEVKPTTRSMETSRIGSGRPNSMTAKDFEGKTDFTDFMELDPEEQTRLMKDMDTKTYQRLIAFSGANKGTEVMRNGRKIVLK